MDLTEAEDIKKSWQEYTEELYKKVTHTPDNHMNSQCQGLPASVSASLSTCLPLVGSSAASQD